MAAKTAVSGTTADRWVDRALRTLLWTVMRLPYTHRVRAMGWLMARVIGPLSGYRRRAATHLAMVYPNMGPRDCKTLATAVCNNFGRTLIENYSWRDLGNRLADTKPCLLYTSPSPRD